MPRPQPGRRGARSMSKRVGMHGVIVALALVVGIGTAAQVPPEPTPATAPAGGADLSGVLELVQEGDYSGADGVLEQLLATHPDDPDALLMRGEVLLALKKPAEAKQILERCLAVDPSRGRARFQLGSALATLGERDAAVAAFGQAIEATDDKTIRLMSHLNRSTLFEQSKRWADSAAELEAALILEPTQVQVYGDLAAVQLQAGDAAAAMAVLERGEAAGFRSASHYYSVGARWIRDAKFEPAVVALNRALAVDPTLARAERSLGFALDKLERREEAARHWARYLELMPAAPDSADVRARLKQNPKK